jgi:hypothetical protein
MGCSTDVGDPVEAKIVRTTIIAVESTPLHGIFLLYGTMSPARKSQPAI